MYRLTWEDSRQGVHDEWITEWRNAVTRYWYVRQNLGGTILGRNFSLDHNTIK